MEKTSDRTAERIALSLMQNKAVSIGPSPSAGKVWLTLHGGEAGSFDALAVARVLAQGGDIETFFRKEF